MGCATSKHRDMPAVVLCRQRYASLEEAIRFRYSLADAHLAYMLSLEGVGGALSSFFDKDLHASSMAPPLQKKKKKGLPEPSASPASKVVHHHAHSNSGSHLHLESDSDSDSDDLSPEALHHHLSGKNSPLHVYGQISYADQESLSSYPAAGYMNSNFNVSYTKTNASASVVYEQKPMIPETVYMGDFPSSSSYFHEDSYSHYGNFFGGPSYNYSSSPAVTPPVASVQSETSSSRSPPPPPPQSSAWDFLNPFHADDNRYYDQLYSSSRESGEVREVEGIPDLEDEEGLQREIVKEVHEDKKLGDGGNSYSNGAATNDADENRSCSDSLYPARKSDSTESNPVELEVHMVDKKVDKEEEEEEEEEEVSGDHGNTPAFDVQFSDDSEIIKEIETLFQRASESGHLLIGVLEVGKMPYKKGVGYHHASSKLLQVTTPSLLDMQLSKSKIVETLSTENGGPAIDEIVGSGNLSSTLHKLYLWEKKLYNEVKIEEKMRVLHDSKSAKLQRLIKRGAEAHKIEATRKLIKDLSSKIRIAIQIVDKISVKINLLRDDELWPQLSELIHDLAKFWKSLLESLRGQCQAIGQARKLDTIASSRRNESNLELTLQLEYELLNWISRFSSWIVAQKGFVRSLNDWLMKCLLYEPEETPDGIVPFSPGRIGAPPIFVICFQWAQMIERISEKDVVDSMRDCARSVFQLWEVDVVELRNIKTKNIGYKDMERKVKSLEKDEKRIQKEIQALDKRLVSGNGNNQMVCQSKTSSSFQISLKLTFETMERFTTELLSGYEELLLRIDEHRQDRLLAQESDQKDV